MLICKFEQVKQEADAKRGIEATGYSVEIDHECKWSTRCVELCQMDEY